MDSFIIPEKRPKKVTQKTVYSDTIVLSAQDSALIAVLPETLSKSVRDCLNEGADVSELAQIVTEAQATYNKLMNSVKQTILKEPKSRHLNEKIRGKLFRVKTKHKPTLSGWQSKNPGFTCGINAVYEELRAKNWEPKMQLSRVFVWGYNPLTYNGGNYLVFSCDFTE